MDDQNLPKTETPPRQYLGVHRSNGPLGPWVLALAAVRALTFLNAGYGSPLCTATNTVVAIPLSIGGARIGLEIGRAMGRPDSGLWVWCGAAVGGVAGHLLGSLVAFAMGFAG